MSTYRVAHLDEIEEFNDGRSPFRPVRAHLGITSFGINSWTASEAGDRLINEHDETDEDEDAQEELYIVQRGSARFELDGEHVDAPEGTLVLVPPGVRRTAFAAVPGTTLIVVGGTPGKVYTPSGWEFWTPLPPLYDAGEYAEAADRGQELLEAHPGYPALLYNLACCESLAGRTQDALDHLRLAIGRAGQLRRLAANDPDLEPLREEPGFADLLREAVGDDR